MKDLNQCFFIGRLTRDADLRATSSGLDVANFSLAVNSSEKSGDLWQDKANFFDFAIFGKTAAGVGPCRSRLKQSSKLSRREIPGALLSQGSSLRIR